MWSRLSRLNKLQPNKPTTYLGEQPEVSEVYVLIPQYDALYFAHFSNQLLTNTTVGLSMSEWATQQLYWTTCCS